MKMSLIYIIFRKYGRRQWEPVFPLLLYNSKDAALDYCKRTAEGNTGYKYEPRPFVEVTPVIAAFISGLRA